MALFSFPRSWTGIYSRSNPTAISTFFMMLKSVSSLPKINALIIRKRKKEKNIITGVVFNFDSSSFEITKGNATTRIINKILGRARM
jgi:hypothetical protein